MAQTAGLVDLDIGKEIFDFATMQLRAQAQALESLMGQDGFVNPAFKLPNTDDSAK